MLIKRTRGAIPAGLFFSALALVASIESAAAPAAVASELREVEVRAEALDLPASGRLGRSVVEIKAAFALHGEDPYFGGLSGLWLAPDGSRLVALTDRNHLFQARLVHDDQDRLVDLVDWTAVGIARAPGDPRGTVAKDSEALAASADGEHLVVAYEGFHRLREIPLARPGAMPRRLPLPQGLGGPSNSGIETLALLGDGSLMAIAERVGARGGGLAGWLIKGSRIQGFAYEPADGFSPTGADALDGVVYLLERRFSLLGGFESRLLALPEDEIRAGSRIEGFPPQFAPEWSSILARRPQPRYALPPGPMASDAPQLPQGGQYHLCKFPWRRRDPAGSDRLPSRSAGAGRASRSVPLRRVNTRADRYWKTARRPLPVRPAKGHRAG
jgi:hypothetical protein